MHPLKLRLVTFTYWLWLFYCRRVVSSASTSFAWLYVFSIQPRLIKHTFQLELFLLFSLRIMPRPPHCPRSPLITATLFCEAHHTTACKLVISVCGQEKRYFSGIKFPFPIWSVNLIFLFMVIFIQVLCCPNISPNLFCLHTTYHNHTIDHASAYHHIITAVRVKCR